MPNAELAADPMVRQAHEAAIAAVNRSAGGTIRYSFETPTSHSVRVDLVLLPDHASCGPFTLGVIAVSMRSPMAPSPSAVRIRLTTWASTD